MKYSLKLATMMLLSIAIEKGHCAPYLAEQQIMSIRQWVIQTITNGFVDRLLVEVRNINKNQYFGVGDAKGPLLPPFSDPLFLPPMEIPIDMTLRNGGHLTGVYERMSGTEVAGLSNIEDDFQFSLNLPPYKASWEMSLTSFRISGQYFLNMSLDNASGIEHHILGRGFGYASVSSIFLQALATFTTVGFVGVMGLDLGLGFKNLFVNGDQGTVDGIPIDWSEFSENLQTQFDDMWTNAEARAQITEVIRCSMDHVINACTIIDLINGSLDCLKLDGNPNCWLNSPVQPPTTIRPSTVPTLYHVDDHTSNDNI